MQSKLLDIIIPVFNKQEFVKDLTSNLGLLCEKNVNVIFVDDGSTDQSLAILKSNLKDNFFIYSKENFGVSSARNYGLRQSKSKYVWFFDPDDEFGSDVFKIIKDLESHHEDILIFNYEINRVVFNNIDYFTFDKYGLFRTDYFCKKYNYFSEKNNMSHIWNKIYKSDFIKNVFFDEFVHLSEDRRFNLELFSKNGKILIKDDFLYKYNMYENGTLSTCKDIRKLEDVYMTNIININYLGGGRKYIKRHIIEQILFRVDLECDNLDKFYKNEHNKFGINLLPFYSLKEFIIFVLLLLGLIKIFFKIYGFFKRFKI